MSAPKVQQSQSAPVAPPPTAAEIQRKLSVHAASPPANHRRKSSFSKSPVMPSALSGTESDSDAASVTFSPPTRHMPLAALDVSNALQPTTSNTIQGGPALEAIAEKVGSGEDTEDDEDDDWDPAGARTQEEAAALDTENVVKSGYLQKKGERRKTWKKRWFVLRQTQLSYYKSSKEYQTLRVLPVSEIHSVSQVTLKRHDYTFGIVIPSRTFYIQASSAAEVDSWVRAINDAKAKLSANTAIVPIAAEGKKHVPPAINVQRSSAMDIQGPLVTAGAGNQTPPPHVAPQSLLSASPSSPSNLNYHLTSSDSDDHDADDAGAPITTPCTSPHMGNATGGPMIQFAADRDPKKVILQGYLMKCGSQRKRWRKRWLVLTSEQLVYAKSHMELGNGIGKLGRNVKVVPLECILDAIECKMSKAAHGLGLTTSASMGGGSTSVTDGGRMSISSNGPHNYATNPPSSSPQHQHYPIGATQQPPSSAAADGPPAPQLPHTFKIITAKRPLVLCAPSEEEEIKWMSAVRALIARRCAATGNCTGFTADNQQGTSNPTSTTGASILQGGQQPSTPQPYQGSIAMSASSSPSKRTSRREGSASISSISATDRGISYSGSQQIIAPRRKDSVSNTRAISAVAT
ncbi:hypothetical protein FRB94_004337 [Tulasnella sp. JGI-2019a]|nr:hypothetical protein FRB93_000338 [Tulasnella sp. JGI-2019a]KAG9015218.1 hypothetical protein FRB94_004337 [Tulasnella sp. JGI-2019a]KAG9039287.1 hypothetical protein FRB95_011872 [Tulasnella sp. JGI-2019a]